MSPAPPDPLSEPAPPAPSEKERLADHEMRILILAPTRNDGRLTQKFLAEAGLAATICASMLELCEEVDSGCGAVLLADEALANGSSAPLAAKLESQPSWSDLPIVIITRSGEEGLRRDHLAMVGPAGNVSIIERPVRPSTLISTFRFALGSRGRQYQVRALLEELEKMTAGLRAADRRKDDFLAMLAHELRNPLASVANAASLLKSSTEPECHEWAAKIIERQTRQLAHLIDDLLDVSRITTGKIRLRKEVMDTAIILDRACESVRPLVRERGHELVCDYRHGGLWLEADPTRVEQIALNLLTNAAKYTPRGGRIELAANRQGSEIFISVHDNGMGIAPDRLPEMFQLFTQGERSIARSEGGLGIGLTIVQKLAEMHGGRVEAHSDGPNQGSTFTIRLPAAPQSLPPVANPSGHPPMHGDAQCVLIVDDNVDSAQGLARLLARAGHQTVLAYDGNQALERAGEHRPSVVVLDIGLPGMDGFEVARRLREGSDTSEALLIAVTGYGQDEDRHHARAAGFDHYMVKPVDLDELKQLIRARAGYRA